jgi:hypothetical protein
MNDNYTTIDNSESECNYSHQSLDSPFIKNECKNSHQSISSPFIKNECKNSHQSISSNSDSESVYIFDKNFYKK